MPQSREVAKRVFAKEFNASDLTFKESDDQYAPLYILTPTGAKCNRIFVVGTITSSENVGNQSDLWIARISDPTGTFIVKAGTFAPEAAQTLSDIAVPSYVAVVGKANVYTTPDGKVLVSIRPESIVIVDEETRNRWVQESIEETAERLQQFKAGSTPDAVKAKEHYNADVEEYKNMLLTAAKSLKQMEVVITSAK